MFSRVVPAILALHPAEPADPLAPAANDRTRQIVEAAYAILQQGGLEGLTIRAVLARTGLARRAFYERFAGKDDLVLAVFVHTIRLATVMFEERIASLGDPIAKLECVIATIARGSLSSDEGGGEARHGAAMSREHLRLADARPADLEAALHPLLRLIERLLADGMAAGSVRQAAPDRLAALVYNLVSTTIHGEFLSSRDLHADPARRAALAAEVWDFCRRAIAA